MAGELVTVTGIEDVCKFLDEAPRVIVRKGFRKALKAGIDVMAREMDARTPVQASSGATVAGEGESHPGDLKRALVTVVAVDEQGQGGTAEAGYGKQGHVANWLEYGHRMVGHKPKKKVSGEVAPRPFMRVAADASADAAIDAFAMSIETTMKQEYEGN